MDLLDIYHILVIESRHVDFDIGMDLAVYLIFIGEDGLGYR